MAPAVVAEKKNPIVLVLILLVFMMRAARTAKQMKATAGASIAHQHNIELQHV